VRLARFPWPFTLLLETGGRVCPFKVWAASSGRARYCALVCLAFMLERGEGGYG
jgi:hypothetical protein